MHCLGQHKGQAQGTAHPAERGQTARTRCWRREIFLNMPCTKQLPALSHQFGRSAGPFVFFCTALPEGRSGKQKAKTTSNFYKIFLHCPKAGAARKQIAKNNQQVDQQGTSRGPEGDQQGTSRGPEGDQQGFSKSSSCTAFIRRC